MICRATALTVTAVMVTVIARVHYTVYYDTVHWSGDGITIMCVEDATSLASQPASARGRTHRTNRDTQKTDDAEGLREYALLQLT